MTPPTRPPTDQHDGPAEPSETGNNAARPYVASIAIGAGGLAACVAIAVFALQLGLVAAGIVAVVPALATLAGLALAITLWIAAELSSARRAGRDGKPQGDMGPTRRAAAAGDVSAQHDALAAVVEALPEPAMIIDRAGRISHDNVALHDLFPKAHVGAQLSHVTRSPELLETLDSAMEMGSRVSVDLEERIPIRRKLLAIVSPLEPFEDGARRVLVVVRDVSEQERLARMRADFIANASHELRTPLASLRGFVETLLGPARNDPEARERFLRIMADQAERMTRLIDDLLSLSRVEMRAHVPPRDIVDLNQIVSLVGQSLEPVAAAAGVTLHTQLLPDAARVRGDRDELVQVVQNLTHNAIRYGRSGGTVELKVAREPRPAGPDRLALSVADDGPGIAAEHLPRLTERFYRVSAVVSREKGGTGLGLAIVRNIVSRHRGELRIRSEVGKGSVFTVFLDAVAGPAD